MRFGIIHALRAHKKEVILMLTMPMHEKLTPIKMISSRTLLGEVSLTIQPVEVTALAHPQNSIIHTVRRIAEENGAQVIDPFDYLVGVERSSGMMNPLQEDGKRPKYKDGNHLAASYVQGLSFLDKLILR